jgi:hypothetical protein
MNYKEYIIKIKGTKWKYRLIPRELFLKVHKDAEVIDHVAITIKQENRIDFTPNELTVETIIHELVHAYMSETYTNSANLENEQMEDIICDMISYNISKIQKQSKRMLKVLLKELELFHMVIE